MLILFSTHSFSGELDGKGLDCKYSNDDGRTNKNMFWFDENKVVDVNAYISGNEIRRQPISRIDTIRYYKYYTNSDIVKWNIGLNYILNRKTLNLKASYPERWKEAYKDFKGSCLVFDSFDKVVERQNQFLEKAKQRQLRKEEEERKAREGNKI